MDAKDVRIDAELWAYDFQTFEVRSGVVIGRTGDRFYLAPAVGDVIERQPFLLYPDRAAAEAAAVSFARYLEPVERRAMNAARTVLGLKTFDPADDDGQDDEKEEHETGNPVGRGLAEDLEELVSAGR